MFSSIYVFLLTAPVLIKKCLKTKRAAFCVVFMCEKVGWGRYEQSSLKKTGGLSEALQSWVPHRGPYRVPDRAKKPPWGATPRQVFPRSFREGVQLGVSDWDWSAFPTWQSNGDLTRLTPWSYHASTCCPVPPLWHPRRTSHPYVPDDVQVQQVVTKAPNRPPPPEEEVMVSGTPKAI